MFATVTLNAPAPASGAVVTLSAPIRRRTCDDDRGRGATTGTFTVQTRAVGGTISRPSPRVRRRLLVGGAVGHCPGGDRHFGVTGPSETETCEMGSNTDQLRSTAARRRRPGPLRPTTDLHRREDVFANDDRRRLTNPVVDCTLPPPPLAAGTTFLTLKVTLVVHDNAGNVSAAAVDNGVRLFPLHFCGY